MRFFFFIGFFLVGFLISAQTSVLKTTDAYVELVNKHRSENVLIKKELDKTSVLGGSVTAFYLKKKLELITTHYGGEFGYLAYSFYVENDSLLFVNERKVILKEPETEKEYSDYEKYVIFNTDKHGTTDLTKWPLTVDISNTYYIDNQTILKYQLKSFNKAMKPLNNEIAETNKDLMFRFQTHLQEVKNE